MNARKFVLQIVGLALTLCLLAGCGSPAAAPTSSSSSPVDFTGHWEDPASAFSLDLSQNGEQLQGSHVVVAQQGNKIDSLDKSIEGSIQENIATIKFQSSFTTNAGTAQIILVDANKILWKVTTPPDGEYYLPTEATLVKKTSASNPSPAGTGTIMGRVHLVGPPTPRMVVYAVDPTTGAWAFAETQAADGEAPFSITVPSGTYQVFGAGADWNTTGVGYTVDYSTLATITVAANQTVSGIEVGPPSQSECGNSMGYPASPDGRFAAAPGPTAECIATSQASGSGPVSPQTNRIQFQPNATSWQISESIAPNATIGFVLYAMKGQRMGINLTTEPSSSTTTPYVVLSLSGADNLIYTFVPVTNWSSELSISQDYYITVMSMSQQTVNYTLSVEVLP